MKAISLKLVFIMLLVSIIPISLGISGCADKRSVLPVGVGPKPHQYPPSICIFARDGLCIDIYKNRYRGLRPEDYIKN